MALSRFAIFGSGGFGRELVRPAMRMLAAKAEMSGAAQELVFVSDNPHGEVFGIPHIHVDALTGQDEAVVAVGDWKLRRAIAGRLRARAGTLVAPSAIIGPGVEIGEGAVFCDYSMMTASVRIGRHFHCNIYSYVAHDCVIGDFVTFAPRVCCNGNVHIRDGAYIGAGAVLKQGSPDQPLIIGEGAIVGMGAVVTKSVPDGAVVVGNPAKPFNPA